LGNFHLVYDGKPVPGLDSPRLQSFLAYLLLHRDSPIPRQQLSFLFWPDSSESQARTNLRNMLFRLREAFPKADDYLEIGSQTIWWKSDSRFKLDLDQFSAAVEKTDLTGSGKDQEAHRQALEGAVSAYGGDLLPSCYDDWIQSEREQHQADYHRLLEELVDFLELEGDFPLAIRHTQLLLRGDPLHEDSYRRLMELYSLNNQKPQAVRTYHQCVDILENELGLDPSHETITLYQSLMEREVAADKPSRISEKGTSLVGRDEVWKKLQDAWRELEHGSRLVLIRGEAGIGKTYLAEEFIRSLRREGINTLVSHSYPTEGELAYTPLTTLLRSERVKSKLSTLEEIWLTELSRLMPELTQEYPDLPEPEQLTENWQRQRLFEASTRALLDGESRLILLLDDLQWCDQETLDWLRFLLEYETSTKLLVIGGVRTEDLTADNPLISLFSNLERSDRITEILLDRLDRAATQELAADLWGDELVESEVEMLFLESEGNPLFVAEMVRAGYLGGEAAGKTLPSKVQAVIETRLNALSTPAREAASTAAVVGREFDFELLFQAGDASEDELLQALDELWGRRLIRDVGEGYNFSHDKFREVVYQDLSPHRRKHYHNKIADALVELHSTSLGKVASQLALHFNQGGKANQAVEYYLLAGDQARTLYARQNAIDCYQQAETLLEEKNDPRSLQIYQGWGDVLLKLVRYDDAADAYQKMLKTAEEIGDCESQAQAWLAVGKIRDRQGDHSSALECAEKALELADDNECEVEKAEAVLLKGQSHYRLGDVKVAEPIIKEALKLSEEGEDQFIRGRCLSQLGLIRDDLGDYQEAQKYKEGALEVFGKLKGDGGKVWIGTTNMNLANTANLRGDYEQAVNLYQKALEVFNERKDQDMIIGCLVNMAAAKAGLGENQQAEKDLRQVLKLTENLEWMGKSITCFLLAEACLGQDKLEEGEQAALDALRYAKETGAQQAMGAAWRSLGKVASMKSARVTIDKKGYQAQDCFQKSDQIFSDLKADGERAHTLKAWAEFEMESGDKKKGKKIWDEAKEIFQRLDMPAEVERMEKR